MSDVSPSIKAEWLALKLAECFVVDEHGRLVGHPHEVVEEVLVLLQQWEDEVVTRPATPLVEPDVWRSPLINDCTGLGCGDSPWLDLTDPPYEGHHR